MKELQPYLYILMRIDLGSLNTGKAVSQGAHAANLFTYDLEEVKRDPSATLEQETKKWIDLYDAWIASADGFGVTVTLAVTGAQLIHAVDVARALGFRADVTHDPSYPIRDGDVTHLIPLDTCGYMFGDKSELSPLLKNFPLYP